MSLFSRLTILFPEHNSRPRLQWIHCQWPQKERYSAERSQRADVDSVFGPNVAVSRSDVGRNSRRNRNLVTKLQVNYRDHFLQDGSKMNASIMRCVGSSETIPYEWRGPVLVLAEEYGLLETSFSMTSGILWTTLQHIASTELLNTTLSVRRYQERVMATSWVLKSTAMTRWSYTAALGLNPLEFLGNTLYVPSQAI